jgi:Flp pilus assembly protein TadG
MKQQTERSESYVTSREAFVQSNSGGIAVMASFGIVAAILVCGALVDYARMTASKTALSAAVDAAALQVAASGSTNMTVLEALAEASIGQNYGSGDQGNVTNISVGSEDGAITVVTQAEVETTFVSITGIESVSIQADATVSTISVNRKDMEVVLVTDMSGDGDLETIKTAARSFADLLVSKDHTDAVKRLALVPASERLYLGSRAVDARGSIKSGKCMNPGCEWYLYIYNNPSMSAWQPYGRIMKKVRDCVTERVGDAAYTDDPPGTAPVGRYYGSNCDSASNEMLPLTSSSDRLSANIDGWSVGGGRGGQIGIAWAWYSLSPTFGLFTGDSAPAAYDNADTLKSVVIVSGGANDTAFCKGVISSDSTSPHSTREPKINCKAQNGDPNAQAVKLCTAMKKKGITIYTVSVGSDSTGASTLSQCASGTEQSYMIESDDQLEDTLVAIAVKLRDGSDYDDGTSHLVD